MLNLKEKLKKTSIYKKILYISFLPYIYILVTMIFYAVYGYSDYFGEVLYGLDAISELLNENLFPFLNCPILVAILCISLIYQFFYIVFSHKKGANKVDFLYPNIPFL